MAWEGIKRFIQRDMAMDLGTANTLIYLRGKGIVLSQPSVVARSIETGEIFAIGEKARQYWGKTPRGIEAVRPLKDGVVADFDATRALVQVLLAKAQSKNPKGLLTPRIIIAVPSMITQVEKKAVLDAARDAGAKKTYLLEETMAAALGADLNIKDSTPKMIVDIGGGTTEIAVIRDSAFVVCKSIGVAGDELDEAIAKHIQKHFGIEIGIIMAEEIKWEIGSATKNSSNLKSSYNAKGKNLRTGVPITIEINSSDIYLAIQEPLLAISSAILSVLDQLGPEDRIIIENNGLTLVGGGALLKGIDQFIEEQTGIQAKIVENPLTSVVNGAGIVVEDFNNYRNLFIN